MNAEERRQAAVVNINIGPGVTPGSFKRGAAAFGYERSESPFPKPPTPLEMLQKIHADLESYLEQLVEENPDGN